jgi:hypothetical protein
MSVIKPFVTSAISSSSKTLAENQLQLIQYLTKQIETNAAEHRKVPSHKQAHNPYRQWPHSRSPSRSKP